PRRASGYTAGSPSLFSSSSSAPSSSANEVQKETKLLLRNAKAANATTNITHQNKYPTTFKRLSEGFLWFKTAQKPPKNSFFGIFIVFFLQNLHGSKK
ncbi:MAG TPA: hypothetical protein PLL05_06775, partial [Muribaculaceae bacterium]|nr:hypothetical protein [Muribaculaceae bacterium]